ncbi:MAG: response regulator transcription factor [Polyangiaceae bacterium]|jgi:two-component system phosphate regulon response regulator PhoB
MARILVIEDEADLREVLEYNLTREGHRVTVAATGADGLRAAREQRPELVLLDLMLPDMPGTTVCKALKKEAQTRDVRVIMVTAKGEEIDRVVGFELGADDYVVKPFSVRELLLRISAVLRRREAAEADFVEFGNLRIDPAAHRAWVDGLEVTLTTLEFKLLVTLYERKNRVQTRSVLLNDIWGIEADITTRTVDTHVKRLREKLMSVGRYIETVRGVGYRFTESPSDENA